jgi:hypothetical protein
MYHGYKNGTYYALSPCLLNNKRRGEKSKEDKKEPKKEEERTRWKNN